ncbi:uncharacterized protein LOC123012041 [Tribolium madens]|uniref:uncharacterized protein LOC123012041 n=1 Tax=Tribolium madens TaxID=41895 RepID=UPI001CF75390|nr:uncharacterized protein LOC123012041 [Tribolium madens]
MKNTRVNFAIALYFLVAWATIAKMDKETLSSPIKVQPRQSGKLDAFLLLRNTQSGYVLQADDYYVVLGDNAKIPKQKWAPEYLHHGKCKIVNQGNGKYLDIEQNATVGSRLITSTPFRDEDNLQLWHIGFEGQIVNSQVGLAATVALPNNSRFAYKTGLPIVGQYYYGVRWQQWGIEFVDYY